MKTKNNLLLFLLMLMGFSIKAQETIQSEDVRYLSKAGISFYVLNLDSCDVGEIKLTEFPMKFILPNTLSVCGEYSEVQFLDFEEVDKKYPSDNWERLVKIIGKKEYINSGDIGKRFFIKTSDLSLYLEDGNIEQQFKIWKGKIITGATLSTPFKFRPKIDGKNYIFTPELSLGPFVGCNFRIDKNQSIFLNGVLSAGINSININDDVQVDEQSKDGLALGFYGSVGVVVQIDDFQVGVLYGHDLVSGEMGDNWIYNEKPWLSFSIGFNFLSNVNKVEAKAKQQTKEINDQLVKKVLEDKDVTEGEIIDSKGNRISFKKKLAEANKTVGIIPKETTQSNDAIIYDTKKLNAAKVIGEVGEFTGKGKWVYFGELEEGKYSGVFGIHELPKKGEKFTANSAVFKRDQCPKLLANGKWEKGNIIGAVEQDETIIVLDAVSTSEGKYLWIKIE